MDPVSEVIREHAPFVWRVLRHHGIPEDQLEDLSQDVFIVICRRLGDFEQRSSLRTWIYGICRNVVFDARRRQRRKQETPSDELPETEAPADQSRALLRKDLQTALRAALASLPEHARMTFVMYEVEHMDMAQIAQSLGCSLSATYARLHAARKHVRAALVADGWLDVESALAEVG